MYRAGGRVRSTGAVSWAQTEVSWNDENRLSSEERVRIGGRSQLSPIPGSVSTETNRGEPKPRDPSNCNLDKPDRPVASMVAPARIALRLSFPLISSPRKMIGLIHENRFSSASARGNLVYRYPGKVKGKRKPGLVSGVCFCRPPGQLPVCASSVRKGRFAVLSFAFVTAKKWCSICRVTLAVADRRVGIGLIMHGAISPYRR